jgi:hypothetical protein
MTSALSSAQGVDEGAKLVAHIPEAVIDGTKLTVKEATPAAPGMGTGDE